MNVDEFLVSRYIRTKNKIRKIVTYKMGENKLRENHQEIADLLNRNCKMSIFTKSYTKNRSIVKNARTHMYNDIFLMFDVKNFFPNINHNYLIKSLYYELNKNIEISRLECADIIRRCSTNKKGLPLGLVTSPVLSNIYLKEFDNILYGKLKKLGYENIIYTRYADDIVISLKNENGVDIGIVKEKIRSVVEKQLKRKGLKINEKKERVYDISITRHVKITGINIIRDDKNYRLVSVGRKRKDELYNRTMQYIELKKNDKDEVLKIKGLESFILSVEGRAYEKCYSKKMIDVIYQAGYSSLHDAIIKLT